MAFKKQELSTQSTQMTDSYGTRSLILIVMLMNKHLGFSAIRDEYFFKVIKAANSFAE